MRKRGGSLASEEEAQINLTSLIDVVFVVLIMFIIVAPMLELDRIELASAMASNQKEAAIVQENSPITLHVHADNSIWFNGKVVSEEQLLTALRLAKRDYPQKIPQLFHDKKAYFGTYQKVKNAVQLSGFEQMDVILEP